MAVVTLELTAETRRRIDADGSRCARAMEVFARGLAAAVGIGADSVREQLVSETLDLHMKSPGQGGLAGGVAGWMIDERAPLAAVGVPSNHPASAYATIQEFGGTIRPVHARALAIPVSREAARYTSPRDMAGLVLIKRPGKPPILARVLGNGRIEVHWVLLSSVTLRARHWLSEGVRRALGDMVAAFRGTIADWLRD